MEAVLVQGHGGHQDVVQVHKTEGEPSSNPVHQSLKGLCRILQAKGGSDELKTAKGCGDGGLGDILGVHRDLVVAPDQVHFGKDGATGQEVGGI